MWQDIQLSKQISSPCSTVVAGTSNNKLLSIIIIQRNNFLLYLHSMLHNACSLICTTQHFSTTSIHHNDFPYIYYTIFCNIHTTQQFYTTQQFSTISIPHNNFLQRLYFSIISHHIYTTQQFSITSILQNNSTLHNNFPLSITSFYCIYITQ